MSSYLALSSRHCLASCLVGPRAVQALCCTAYNLKQLHVVWCHCSSCDMAACQSCLFDFMQGLAPGSPTFSESNQADVRKRPAGGVQKPGKVNFAQKPKQTLGISDEFGESHSRKVVSLGVSKAAVVSPVQTYLCVEQAICCLNHAHAALTFACCLTGFTAKNETFVGEI